MAKNRKRIDTSGGEALSSENPFSNLGMEGLKQHVPFTQQQDLSANQSTRKSPPLVLRRLKAGKGGKVVTEISGFTLPSTEIDTFLKRLQSRLGTGGTRKGNTIELQGERRLELKGILEAEGFTVKGV